MLIIVYFLLTLVGLIIFLLLAACIRAMQIKTKIPRMETLKSNEGLSAKYAENLSKMLQCETINDPNVPVEEVSEKFRKFHQVLKQLYPLTHERLDNIPLGDALLLHWKGQDSSRPAIVLMAHSDVVAASGQWKYPPFSGEIAEGSIWGRGAMDTKGSLCAIFEAVEGLISEGFTPVCDVYISSSNNEETLGDGAKKAVKYLLDHGVKLDLVSDEGGAVIESPLPGTQGFYAMLGIVEKGHANVRFTAKSSGGHASTPPKNTPMAKLAAFINYMEKHPPFVSKFSPPVVNMFTTLAPHMSFSYRLLFGNLWLFKPFLVKLLPMVNSQAGAMLHTTCVFTMAQGSPAANIIPETASVTANLRFIMHQPMEESLGLVKAAAEKFGLETEVLYAHDCSPFTDINNEQYRYVLDCVEKVFPEAVAVPYVMLGGTDACRFAPHCPCTVRFSPTVLSAQQLNSAHGLDENLSVSSLARAVEFYELMLRNYKLPTPEKSIITDN